MKLLEMLRAYHRQVLKLPTDLSCCNPSLARTPEGWCMTVRALDPIRGHGADDGLSSENWLIQMDADFVQQTVSRTDDSGLRRHPECRNGLEDGRVFFWRGELWALFSGFRREGQSFFNTMVLARLEQNTWVDRQVLLSPFGYVREKNWMPCVVGDDLFVVYSVEPLRVFQVVDGRLQPCEPAPENRTTSLAGSIVSGSSNLVATEEGCWAVVHHRRKLGAIRKLYLKHWKKDPEYQIKKVIFDHHMVKFDRSFNLVARSRAFSFEFEGVEFCSGMHLEHGRVYLSYGVRDRIPVILEADFEEVKRLIGF